MASLPGTNITNKFGNVTGFADLEFNMLSHDVVGIKDVAYSSELEIEAIFGKGRTPVGSGSGNMKATASMSILFEEWQSLLSSIPIGKTYHDFEFDLTVTFDFNGVAMADIIRNCRIKKADRSASQGDKEIVVKMELYCSHVDEGVTI